MEACDISLNKRKVSTISTIELGGQGDPRRPSV